MRHLRRYHTVAIVALAALSVSLLSTTTTDAWPLREGSLHNAQLINDNDAVLHAVSLQKRQLKAPVIPGKPDATTDGPSKPTVDPEPSKPVTTKEPAPKPTNPNTTPNPNPPTKPTAPANPAPHPTTSDKAPARTASGTAANTIAPTGSNGAQPTGPIPEPKGENSVPTEVSHQVLIGLGTVGGMIVFALGGLAFCRHRRKKNLAKALLQQTAQFNNNNPYAKLSEPGTPAKESLPMTPTKPLGSFNAISAYIPQMTDEIEIGVGDILTITQEYDDGWCFGANNSRGGIRGAFPRYVFEAHYGGNQGGAGGEPGPGYYPPDQGFKPTMNKRMSSMPVGGGGGWNNGPPGYNGGYGNQPPPNPNQYQDQGQGYFNQGGY